MLQQAFSCQVLVHDDIVDCIHDKLDLFCLSGASEMGVDLLGIRSSIECYELL